MISITPEEQVAWQSGTQKDLTLVFDINGTTKTLDNSDIVSESMSLKQTVSDDASNIFGSVYASEFNIRVFDDGTRYKGATVTATLSVTFGEETYSRQLGVFEVVSDKLTADGISRNLVCYDKLSTILAKDYSDWHNSMTYPLTIRSYRNAFLAYVGLSYEVATLPNDTITINKNEVTTASGAIILSSILGLNACWGYIGMDNVFHYALPKTTADYVITDNSFVQGSYAFEEFQTAEYSGIIFTNSITTTVTDGDESHEEYSEQNVTVGDATGSVLNFQDNILLKGKTDSELTTIGNHLLTTLDGFIYTPSTVTFPPYMGLELGDVFQITTEKGTYSFPVLDRTMSGITALKDTFSAEGVEYSAENANSLQTFMARYQASLSDVSALLNKTSEIASNANSIAGKTNQYFWHTETGTDTGAHITEIPKDDFLDDPENGGGNLLARSNGIAVRNGLDEIASFGSSIILGQVSDGMYNTHIDNSSIKLRNNTTVLASFGSSIVLGNIAQNKMYINISNDEIDFNYLDGSSSIHNALYIYGGLQNNKFYSSIGVGKLNLNYFEETGLALISAGDDTGHRPLTIRATKIDIQKADVDTAECNVHAWGGGFMTHGALFNSSSTPSSNKYDRGFSMLDTDGNIIAYTRGMKRTNGNQGIQVEAHRVVNSSNKYNTLNLLIKDNGDSVIEVSSPAAWRSALGFKGTTTLWTGVYYPTASQTATLSQNISDQALGIVLVWSAYVDGGAKDYDWVYYFIPKWHGGNHSGQGVDVSMGTGGGTKWGGKYVYVYNNKIVGHANNSSGDSAYWVLRAVIGV